MYVVVCDGVEPEDVRRGIDTTNPRVDLCAVLTLEAFAKQATVGEPDEWNRYNFAHLTPTFASM